MSVSYTSVGWNRQKRLYDVVMASAIVLFVAAFFGVGKLVSAAGEGAHDDAMLLIRGLGVCGLAMLHVVLWIGPLCRLDRRFLPLLYNRRHLGVATFSVGLAHAAITIVQYHGFGDASPLVSLLSANTNYGRLTGFPFETLGLLALVILFLMAATSHDFWLATLSARAWKWLHMGVYLAYGLLVMHVTLGVLQQERSPVLAAALVVGAAVTVGLHIAAGRREGLADRGEPPAGREGWLDVASLAEIPLDRAKVICTPGGERIAVFKYADKASGACRISAVANVCAHQQGPLGEGKVVDGCITCPWHGYQYQPADGCAPPPFHEKIATYRVTVRGDRICVDPRPLPPGTPVPPASLPTAPTPPPGPGAKEAAHA